LGWGFFPSIAESGKLAIRRESQHESNGFLCDLRAFAVNDFLLAELNTYSPPGAKSEKKGNKSNAFIHEWTPINTNKSS